MVFCSKCGAKNSSHDKFCSECGEPLKSHSKKTHNNTIPKEVIKEIIVKEKSSGQGFFIFILLLLILGGGAFAFIYFSEQHATGGFTDFVKEVRSPKLSVSNSNSDMGFSFSKGCYGTISGILQNTGNADADSASVECNLMKNTGGLLKSGSAYVGQVFANSQKSFSFEIDFKCSSLITEKDMYLDCRTDCSNC